MKWLLLMLGLQMIQEAQIVLKMLDHGLIIVNTILHTKWWAICMVHYLIQSTLIIIDFSLLIKTKASLAWVKPVLLTSLKFAKQNCVKFIFTYMVAVWILQIFNLILWKILKWTRLLKLINSLLSILKLQILNCQIILQTRAGTFTGIQSRLMI